MEINFAYELRDREKEKWTQFWLRCKHTHHRQHLAFSEIEKAKGRIPIFASGEFGGQLVCIGVFSIRPLWFDRKFSFEAICLRGPAFDDYTYAREFLIEILRRFKTLKVGSVRVSPYWVFPEAQPVEELLVELGFHPYAGVFKARSYTGLIDASYDDDEIIYRFSKSARREVRRAQRQGVLVRAADTPQEAEMFFRELNAMLEKRDLTPFAPKEYRTLFQEIIKGQEMGVVLNAFKDASFLGGLLVYKNPNTAHTAHFVVVPETLRKLSNLRIAPLVWWYGIKWARDHSCHLVDVGGYCANPDSSNLHYNIHQYKEGFNPTPVQIVGQYEYVCNTFVYAAYRKYRFFKRTLNSIRTLPYKIRTRLSARKRTVRLGDKN